MSAASTASATQTTPNPADTDKPSRAGILLGLVRKLIDYGKELAATLRQRGAGADLYPLVLGFGTLDIARILACITCGLHRAQALEARLVRNAARLDAERKPAAAPSRRKPRAAAATPPAPDDPRLARLPTPEQIAAQVRRRPIGAVLADICRDLGLTTNHPLWQELSHEIIRYGGSLAALHKDLCQRAVRTARSWLATRPASWVAPPAPPPAPGGTGPP